jgi:hypothetical protein
MHGSTGGGSLRHIAHAGVDRRSSTGFAYDLFGPRLEFSRSYGAMDKDCDAAAPRLAISMLIAFVSITLSHSLMDERQRI